MRKINVKLEVVFKYITIMLMIMVSGTLIFNIKYNSVCIPFWCGFAFLTNAISNKKCIVSLRNINEPLYVFCLVLLNTLIYITSGVELNGIVQISFYILGTVAVCSAFTFEEYKKYFINCTVFLAMISAIVFFMLYNGRLSFEPETINGKTYTIAGLFHVVGWDGYLFSRRLSGLFFEPGMYQIILNISILYLLDSIIDTEHLKREIKSILKLIVLITCVILTKSTAAYIILAMTSFLFFAKKRKTLSARWVAVVYFCAIPVIGMVVWFLLTNEVVVGKFQTGNESFALRLNDLLSGIKITFGSPIIGWGYKTEALSNIMQKNNINNISNGLLEYTATFGIPFTLVVLMCVYHKKKEFKFNILYVLLFFIIQNSVESCLFFPSLLVFLFKFKKEILY